LRRTIIIGTALAVLAGSGIAFAASHFNIYTAVEKFCSNTPSSTALSASCTPAKAGSNTKPVAVALGEHWTAKGNASTGNARTRPLTKTVVKNFGIITNGKVFPKCTASQINSAGNAKDWNKVCPKGSLIGGGPVESQLGASSGTGPTSPCNPYLYVYNGGANTQTFLFAVGPQSPGGKYSCATAKTGTSCAAYTGTLSRSGSYSVTTINLPPCASTKAANLSGIYASLQQLDVVYPDKTKFNGKTYMQSVACQSGKRPYSTTFTAQNFAGQSPSTDTQTISGKAPC
jgi:hypothetical protein